MHAHVLTRFGGPESLELADLPAPEAGAGQVRVRIAAIGINPIEYKIRNGWLQEVVPTVFPAVLGSEIAGTIDQVGDGVEGFAVGDRVTGFADGGSYAAFTVTRAVTVTPIPDGLGFEQAATIPVGAETALRTVPPLGVRSGDTVVVNGAAGAVGSAAVQLLVRDGVRVVGTASGHNHDYVRALGATPVAYGDGVLDRIRAAAPQGVDAALDAGGHGFAAAAIELVGDPSRIVTTVDFEAAALGVVIAPGDLAGITAAPLGPVVALAADGGYATEISRTFPFAELPAALALSETGHVRGKIVVTGAEAP